MDIISISMSSKVRSWVCVCIISLVWEILGTARKLAVTERTWNTHTHTELLDCLSLRLFLTHTLTLSHFLNVSMLSHTHTHTELISKFQKKVCEPKNICVYYKNCQTSLACAQCAANKQGNKYSRTGQRRNEKRGN